MRAALAADDCRSVVNRLAHTVAWYNPLVFIRICDLLADVDDPSGPLPVPCGGLNREVANKGLFLVACKALVRIQTSARLEKKRFSGLQMPRNCIFLRFRMFLIRCTTVK